MFSKILAKDFKSLFRQKRGITIAILPVIVAFFAILYTVLMYIVMKYISIDDPTIEEIGFAKMSYLSSTSMFCTFMLTYGLIVTMILAGSLISSEIKNKQWILPLNAGHSSKKLFLSKLVSSECWIAGSTIIGMLVHFLFTVIFCDPNGSFVWQILVTYLFIMLIILFYVDIIVCFNFITKKAWVGILISIVCVLILPDLLFEIPIGTENLCAYTPFSLTILCNSGALFTTEKFTSIFTTAQWISTIISYVAVVVLLPVWAISVSKIKPKK